jgi:dTDP-glucose pyrophosphorylase
MALARHKSIIVKIGTPLRKALAAINSNSLAIALIIDKGDRLIGTVTDGDIRRALLAGVTLDKKVELVMHKNPTTARAGTSRDELLRLMKLHQVSQIPLVDAQGRVIGIEILSELLEGPKIKQNPVVIFAGGLGKRLYPLTAETPKPMLPVGGRPVLEHIIQRLAVHGFVNIYLALHYKGEQIEQQLGDGKSLGVNISYVREPEPLGTVGALRLIKSELKMDFLVLNADLLTAVNFEHFMEHHIGTKNELTVGVKEFATQLPYGVVKLQGTSIMALNEKPVETHLVSVGIYGMNPSVLSLIPPKGPYDMPSLITASIKRKRKVAAFLINDYWLDIGTKSDYEKAQRDIQELGDK